MRQHINLQGLLNTHKNIHMYSIFSISVALSTMFTVT